MPRYKWRGEHVRLKKGKYGSKVLRDISEQCAIMDCDEEYLTKKAVESPVDPRTADRIVLDALDEFYNKSCQIRSKALTTVCNQLQQMHNPGLVSRHKYRLMNVIRTALESNIPCEMDAASILLSLAAIQLPDDDDQSIQVFYEPLTLALNDEYLRLSTRFAVLHAIGILTFLYETNRRYIYSILKRFKGCFAGQTDGLRMAAYTWTFLMTLSRKKPFFWLQVIKYLKKDVGTPHRRRELKIGGCEFNFGNWALRIQYEMLSNVIGSTNVTKHLAENEKLLTKLNMARSTNFDLDQLDLPSASPGTLPSEEDYSSASITPPHNGYSIEKLSKNLMLARHKSSVERAQALEDISIELHLVPVSFLEDQKTFILDIILKAMKRGNETEQLAAVRLATFTIFKLGRDERFCTEISRAFFDCFEHSTTFISTDAMICTALAFIELMDHEYGDRTFMEPTMSLLRETYLQCRNTVTEDSPQDLLNILRTRALESWGLLLTMCSLEDVRNHFGYKQIDELTELMTNDPTVEIRIACGQVISLIIEQGQLRQTEYFKPDISLVISRVINDQRNASSYQRKLLNTNLRGLLKYLEDGSQPSFKLRFHYEIHELKTWSSLFKYQKLSQFIGPNLAGHFVENERVRAIVPIGPKPVKQFWCPQPCVQHKLNCAAKKKSKTKLTRLNDVAPKFGYL